MSEQQTQAASSPAEVQDVFQGQQPTMAEYASYRQTGEVPARFKPAEKAESAPAAAPEETVESEGDEPETAPESESEDEAQEPPQKGSGAEKRIKQLLAKVKELERIATAAKPDASASSPAQPQQPQAADKEPTIEDTNPDGTPKFKTYEDYVRAQARWEARQEIAEVLRKQAEQQALQTLKAKLDESRARYEDADEVIFPAAQTIRDAQIPQAVKEVFSQSDLFTDLCYVVGSDPAELNKFISLAQSNPRAALAKVFEYERGIREELSKAGKEAAEPSGKAPEKKQTQAPKPPSPVGGGSSRAFDVSDESLSADEWAKKRNAQLLKRRG